MNDDFNTNWDPYQQLLLDGKNIQQLAVALNDQMTKLNEVRSLSSHQQEVIQQLVHQNNRLNQLATAHRAELTRLRTEIDLLKVDLLSKSP
jgi:hypothetical protein